MVNDLDPPPRAIRIVCSVCRTLLCVHVFILLSFGQGSGSGPATAHTSRFHINSLRQKCNVTYGYEFLSTVI